MPSGMSGGGCDWIAMTGLRVCLVGVLLRVERVLKRLLAQFVGGHVVSLTVSGCGSGMGVGSKVVEFSGAIVGALGHRAENLSCFRCVSPNARQSDL